MASGMTVIRLSLKLSVRSAGRSRSGSGKAEIFRAPREMSARRTREATEGSVKEKALRADFAFLRNR
jgi:hypothetical protein